MQEIKQTDLKPGEKYIVETEQGEKETFEYLGEGNALIRETETFLVKTDKVYTVK